MKKFILYSFIVACMLNISNAQDFQSARRLHEYYSYRNNLYAYNVTCKADNDKNANVVCGQSLVTFPQIPMPTLGYDNYGNMTMGFSEVEKTPVVSRALINHQGRYYTINFKYNASLITTFVDDVVVTKGDILELEFKEGGDVRIQVGWNQTISEWNQYRQNLMNLSAWENTPAGRQAYLFGVQQVFNQGNSIINSTNNSHPSTNCAVAKYMYERQKRAVQDGESLLSSMERSGSVMAGAQASNLTQSRQRLYQLQNSLSSCN